MGRNRSGKRKIRQRSDNSENNDSVCKAGRYTASPQCENITVSTLLKETNSVLYDDRGADSELDFNDLFDDSNFSTVCDCVTQELGDTISPTHTSTMEPSSKVQSHSKSPSNADIMTYLKEMNNKMSGIEKKLEKIDILEKKVVSFEKEVTKMWTYVHDNNKQLNSRICAAGDKVESVDFSLGVVNDKVVQLEKERDSLKDEIVYLQSQSMRNNLVFANIQEPARGEVEDCEKTLRQFLSKDMKIAQELVDKLSFERVHRMGRDYKIRAVRSWQNFHSLRKEKWLDGNGMRLRGLTIMCMNNFQRRSWIRDGNCYPYLSKQKRTTRKLGCHTTHYTSRVCQ